MRPILLSITMAHLTMGLGRWRVLTLNGLACRALAAAGLLSVLALLSLFGLAGCASFSGEPLEPSVTTEAEVRARWGEPGRVWPVPAGGRALEYSQQPSGHTAYMVDIGPDGKVAAVRQVLKRETFARVLVGMTPDEVLRLLGRPMQITTYRLKQLTYYDWRYLDGPTRDNSAVFSAVFDASMRVVSTLSVRDPDLDVHPDPRVGLFGAPHWAQAVNRLWVMPGAMR
jgi:hypothetical protein